MMTVSEAASYASLSLAFALELEIVIIPQIIEHNERYAHHTYENVYV